MTCLFVHTSHYWVTYLTNTIDCDVYLCPYIPLLGDIFDEHNRLWCLTLCPYIPIVGDIFDEQNRLWCVWMSIHSITGWHIWRTQQIVMCLNVHTFHYWVTYLTNTTDCDVSECPYIPLLGDIFDEHSRLWCVWMSIHSITGWYIWRTQQIVMCLNFHTSHYWMTYLTNTIDCDVFEFPYIPLLDDIFDEHNRLWCVWMSIHPITGWHIWQTQ